VTFSKRQEPVAVRRTIDKLPRLPLEGSIDLTYRCNNACRHCWLWEPDTPEERARELTTDEWRAVVDQARALGTREWAISGGEPLLREDFAELFEYMTSKATTYSLNTNGTLITPEIAQLMKRKGSKMVALYGATETVHDHVTRTPGSYAATMEGLARLKEAGVGFTVQIVPMRDNYQELAAMQELAQSLSPQYRIGAAWLHMTACHSVARNAEIARQRLTAAEVVALDLPDCSDVGLQALGGGEALDDNEARGDSGASGGEEAAGAGEPACGGAPTDDRLFAGCVAARRDFHVDPYGGMTFCSFIKDPDLRYDLRTGTVREGWEEFIPSLAEKVRAGLEYVDGCAVCDLRDECRWCGVYGALEHGVPGARIDYLCQVAREARAYADDWAANHTRYYEIAGVTVKVESDLPITDSTFDKKFVSFRVDGPGDDTVVIRHHFGLPDLDGRETWEEVFRTPPWAIYRRGESWVYLGIAPDDADPALHLVAVFNADHTRGELYNEEAYEQWWRDGGLGSLTMFPTDQILLARLMADRQGCFLHSGGLTIDGAGLLFVGHSDAGKSTTMELVRRELGERAEILCDDRNIVRRWPEGFRLHGTWSHGDVPDVSSASAPLRAILFLEQAPRNEIVPLSDRRQIWQRLLATLIKPMVTTEWWQKELDVVERIVDEVPCYAMRFDKSGAIVAELDQLTR
jgi:MoaA/NifB/PqqE/SkfB family radical SAM enzyme